MHHILFAFHQRARRSNHVELSLGVVSLLHNSDHLASVVARMLSNTRKTSIDVHIDGMQRYVVRILSHVHPNFHLDEVIIFSQKDEVT